MSAGGRGWRGPAEALIGAALVVLGAGLLDRWVADIQRTGEGIFSEAFAWACSIEVVAIGGGALVIGLLAWRSRSIAVGIVYALAGGLMVFLFPIGALLQVDVVWRISDWVWSGGPIDGLPVIAGALLVAGVASMVLEARSRGSADAAGSTSLAADGLTAAASSDHHSPEGE